MLFLVVFGENSGRGCTGCTGATEEEVATGNDETGNRAGWWSLQVINAGKIIQVARC